MTTDSEQRVSDDIATYAPVSEVSAGLPKIDRRGTNPASLANLKPAWTPETRPEPTNPGPVLTPRLRKLADLSTLELERKLKDKNLPAAERTAVVWWLDSHKGNVRYGTGHHSRAQLADRLDGPVNKQEVNVNIGVVIRGYGELDEGSIG